MQRYENNLPFSAFVHYLCSFHEIAGCYENKTKTENVITFMYASCIVNFPCSCSLNLGKGRVAPGRLLSLVEWNGIESPEGISSCSPRVHFILEMKVKLLNYNSFVVLVTVSGRNGIHKMSGPQTTCTI